ncbi:Forkhead box protein I1 [Dissostichus eleginoides]|uniref:Forkhead box protein I1 n=1 Tax=Dissostichus eleginoides TaxID=100907 RepID=A0AAD9C8J8_DISEL|nr:Forkhead box protein I1 [Dissostichus eleginoides]
MAGGLLAERMDGCSPHGETGSPRQRPCIAPRNASCFPGRLRGVQSHRNTHSPSEGLRLNLKVRRDTTPSCSEVRGRRSQQDFISQLQAIKAENDAQLVHVQPPAENKVPGVMEGALNREAEGDEASSAEIEC